MTDQPATNKELAVAFSMMLCVAVSYAGEVNVPAEARKASRALQESTKSGECRGVIRVWGRENELSKAITFHTRFDGNLINAVFDYAPVNGGKSDWTKCVLINDGKACYCTIFSPRIKPSGCETYIRSKPDSFLPTLRTSLMPWQLSSYARLTEVLDKFKPEFKQTKPGHYVAAYRITPKTHSTAEIDESAGYNVVKWGLRNDDSSDGETSTQVEVEWKQFNKEWYVSRLLRTEVRKGELRSREEVTVDEIKLGSSFAPKVFQFSSFETCPGSRVVDSRPDAVVKVYRPQTLWEIVSEGMSLETQSDKVRK